MAQANALPQTQPAKKPAATPVTPATSAKTAPTPGERVFIFPPTAAGQSEPPQTENPPKTGKVLKFPEEKTTRVWTKKVDIKQLPELFALTSPSYRAWAKEFLAGLIEVALEGDGPKEGLLEARPISVWFKPESYPKKLKTTTHERLDTTQDQHLFPTDVVNLFCQLAEKLQVPTDRTEVILLDAEVANGVFSEQKLAGSGAIYKLLNQFIYQLIAKLNQFERDEGEEAELPTTVTQDSADEKTQAPATAKVVAVSGSGTAAAASQDGGDSQADGKDQESAQTEASRQDQAAQLTTYTREQQKAINYETAWLYHHAAFELFGEAGFAQDDPRFLLLKKEINSYLSSSLSPEQIQESFANPAARLRALRIVYSNLAVNPEFVTWQNLANQQALDIENKLPKPGQEADNNLKKAASEIIQEELVRRLQNDQIVIDGALLKNLGYSVDTMALALGNPQLAKQFNLPVSEKKDVVKFINSLTPDQIILMFFAGNQNKKYIEWVKANKELIGNVLAGAITARSVDIAINASSIAILSGMATEMELHNFSTRSQPGSFAQIRKAVIEADKLSQEGGGETVARAISQDSQKAKKEFELFVLKIWSSLSPEAQEWAYVEWFGMKPGDLDHQKNSDGRLPFNPILIGIDWGEFVKNADKLKRLLGELKESGADAAKLKSIARAMQELNISSQLRDAWFQAFLKGLGRDQLAHLAKTEYVKRVERALEIAGQTLTTAKPGSRDWMEAAAIVGRLQEIIDHDQLGQSIHPALLKQYQAQIAAIQEKQQALVELIVLEQNIQAEEIQEVWQTVILSENSSVQEVAETLMLIQAAQQQTDSVNVILADSSPMEISSDAEQYNQEAAEVAAEMGLDPSQAPQMISNPALRGANAVANMVKTAQTLSNVARAAAGDVTAAAKVAKDLATFWSNPENRRKVYELLSGIIGGGIGALVAIVSQIMGIAGAAGGAVIGGVLGGAAGGFLIGGPVGAIVGGVGGAVAGGLIGNKLAAQHALSGVADLTPAEVSRLTSQNPQLSQAAADQAATQSSLAQSGQANVFNQVTAPSQVAVSSATSASLVGFGSVAFLGPVLGLGTVYLLTIITMLTIFGAFLIPLPVGNQSVTGTNQSAYLSLSKQALPKKIENNQTIDVSYLIRIKPSRGYQITILDIQDKMEFINNKKEQPGSKNPKIEPAKDYLPSYSKEAFGTPLDLNYILKLDGGQDTVVNNTVTIKYNVTDKQGQVAQNETLTAQTAITIGSPKVRCWPTSGTITQLPYGNFTHGKLDSYDIVGPVGTNIYTPFEGDAYHDGSLTSDGYGLYVTLEATSGHAFVFGHLSKVSNNIPKRGAGIKRVLPGDELGKMGNSGFSTAPHLHYEHLGSYSSSGQKRKILDTLIPAIPTFGQMVYTCF